MEAATKERAALVALLRRPGANWSEIALDIQETGSAIAVLDRTVGRSDTLFHEAGTVAELIGAAAEEIAGWQADGIDVRCFFDVGYPAQLLGIREMPPVLFTRGDVRAQDRAVAVVGSRNATDAGLRIANAVATSLAGRGVTVASGLAAGVDTAAHTAALAAGGRTVAVIDTGIRRYYERLRATGSPARALRAGVLRRDKRSWKPRHRLGCLDFHDHLTLAGRPRDEGDRNTASLPSRHRPHSHCPVRRSHRLDGERLR